jgi:hypothetical protein
MRKLSDIEIAIIVFGVAILGIYIYTEVNSFKEKLAKYGL